MNTAALRAPAHSQVYTGRLAPFVRERRRTRIPGLELLRTFRPPGDISAPAASDFGLVVALGRAPYECDVNAGGVRYRGAIRRGDAYLRLAGVPTEAHGLSAQDALVVPLPITVLSPGLQSARADARAFDSLQGRPFRDPLLLAVLERLWDEAATTLRPPPGLDVPRYRGALRGRFANAALQHRTRQIAMDGSQKLPQRLLNTLRDRLSEGRSIEALSLGVAGWMRWQLGRDEAGRDYTVDDPLAPRTQPLAQAAAGGGGRALATALLGVEQVFSPDLAASAPLQEALAGHLDVMLSDGAEAAVARLIQLQVV